MHGYLEIQEKHRTVEFLEFSNIVVIVYVFYEFSKFLDLVGPCSKIQLLDNLFIRTHVG